MDPGREAGPHKKQTFVCVRGLVFYQGVLVLSEGGLSFVLAHDPDKTKTPPPLSSVVDGI